MFEREKMQSFIENSGIKQKHIAEQAELTECALSLILTGKRKCNVGEYVAICRALDVSFDTFIQQSNKTITSPLAAAL